MYKAWFEGVEPDGDGIARYPTAGEVLMPEGEDLYLALEHNSATTWIKIINEDGEFVLEIEEQA